MPKVSIIVPVYNREKYLRNCLESLINQTLKDIEIICIDDGSTDNSAKILKSYAEKDKRFVIFLIDNSGSSVARNIGIEHSKGKYIGFIDSDDYISQNYFEDLYNCAEKYNSDIAMTENVIVTNGINQYNKFHFSNKKIISTIQDKGEIIIASGILWNKIYRRNFIMQNKIMNCNTNATIGDDNYFTFIALFYSDKIAITNTPIYYYIQHPSSLTNLFDKRIFLMFKIYSEIEFFLQNRKISSSDKYEWFKIVEQREKSDFKTTYKKLKNELNLKIKFILKSKYHFIKLTIAKLIACPKEQLKNFVFSAKNQDIHKVITIFGIKIKLKKTCLEF